MCLSRNGKICGVFHLTATGLWPMLFVPRVRQIVLVDSIFY